MSEHSEVVNTIGRRDFTLQAALALLAGVVITIDGCGGSSSNPMAPATVVNDVHGSISANHGHVATSPARRLPQQTPCLWTSRAPQRTRTR